VAGNLVVEFLNRLGSIENVLTRWNHLPIDESVRVILPCCGSTAWARGMGARRPLADEAALLAAANEMWRNLAQSDWIEAFESHPRVGESRPSGLKAQSSPVVDSRDQSVGWSAQEQSNVTDSDVAAKAALADANREYERRFDRIFIVCATGKSALEILEILRRRLKNDGETELLEAAEQQRQIMEIRLRKWLQA